MTDSRWDHLEKRQKTQVARVYKMSSLNIAGKRKLNDSNSAVMILEDILPRLNGHLSNATEMYQRRISPTRQEYIVK